VEKHYRCCWSSSFPCLLSLNVSSCMSMRVWVYSRGRFLSLLVDSLEHLWMPDRIFPRLKGRKNVFPFFLFDYWVALFTGRCGRCRRCQTKRIPFHFCRSTRHRRHDAVTFKRCIVTIVLLKDNSIRIRFLY
jgi:hypothetical protein